MADRAEPLARDALEAEIEDIAATLWATLFDVPLLPGPAGPIEPAPMVTGCVQIVGAWRGAVTLQVPLPLARNLAEQMLQPEEPPTIADVRDAVGELANVIGGNVKALFPGPSQTSLPAVSVGMDYKFGVVETAVATEVSFTCGLMPARVTLFQAQAEDRGG